MLDVLDVIAGLALALVVVSLALVWAIRTAWRLMCNLRDEETEHAHTRRRLADVEAIRRRDAVANAHDDGGPCTDCGTTGWGSDHDEDCRNHPGRRFDPEEVSELPVSLHVSREAVGEVVELGKPIQPIYGERAIDRAYAGAGIMPVADYVAKHDREPLQ